MKVICVKKYNWDGRVTVGEIYTQVDDTACPCCGSRMVQITEVLGGTRCVCGTKCPKGTWFTADMFQSVYGEGSHEIATEEIEIFKLPLMKKQTIVGQEDLMAEINRIFDIFKASECELRPHFILTGPSGSGKSFTIKTLALKHQLGFFEINAAQLTKEGTSGNSLSKALTPLLQFTNKPTICFVDEWDKLFISGNSNDSQAHESTTGVQNEFLKVLESDTSSVFGDYGKYINVSSSNVLFVFAGAFNGEKDITLDRLRELGMKTEFLGRVGLVYNTNPLTLEDLFAVLDNSETLYNYLQLFKNSDREKVTYELKAHLQKHYELNTLGARLVNTLIHQYFIRGGKLKDATVKKTTFQKKLEL